MIDLQEWIVKTIFDIIYTVLLLLGHRKSKE